MRSAGRGTPGRGEFSLREFLNSCSAQERNLQGGKRFDRWAMGGWGGRLEELKSIDCKGKPDLAEERNPPCVRANSRG